MSSSPRRLGPLIGRILQACDVCYERKIKCDREMQCHHCTTAGVTCQRTRPRSVRRRIKKRMYPRDAALSRSLSSDVIHGHEHPISVSVGVPQCSRQGQGLQPLNNSLPTTAYASPRSTPMSTPHDDTTYTGNLLQQELNSRTSLSPDRTWVLESAISFVTKCVTSAQRSDEPQPESPENDAAPLASDKIPSELFYTMFLGQCGSTTSPYHWPDHISTSTLKQMCMDLSSNSVSGQIAIHYNVCVFYKATAYISRLLRFCEPGFLYDELENSQKEYATKCQRLLKSVDLVSHPGIGTLQALLSGATLVLLLGRTTQAWTLAALACRILVSLNLHTVTQSGMADESKSDIRLSLYWCFYLDKTLSMLLARPSSLPRLSWDPAAFVPVSAENPLVHKAKASVRIAQVQDICLWLLGEHPTIDESRVSETVLSLERELHSIREGIMELQDQWFKTPELKLEWNMMSFTIYSLLTTVMRFDTTSLHNPGKREQCLFYARQALLAMQEFRPNVHGSRNATTDFFSWTVLLYPVTPFFVVFCNCVVTSSMSDLELLQTATGIMSQIKEQCTLSMNLFKLFTHLVDLCGHLNDVQIQRTRQQLIQHQEAESGSAPGNSKHQFSPDQFHRPQIVTREDESHDRTTPGSQTQLWQAVVQDDRLLHSAELSDNGWEDELSWELLNLQPSVDLFNLAMFDLDMDGS